MRVLIPTYLQDVHASVVGHALRLKGHEAVLWHGADFPTRQQASISLSEGEGFGWELSGPELDLAGDRFDVVWYRRQVPPVLPTEDLHEGDRRIAEQSCLALYRAMWHLVAPDARWVNPAESRARSISKPVQLVEARRSGLKVPLTLFSNDPAHIRRFLTEHEGQTIYKSFAPFQWVREDGIALMFATDITLDDLPDDEDLRLSAGIFQRKVQKAYELRVTYIGDYAAVMKIYSQETPGARTDSKAAGLDALRVEKAHSLPEDVDRACRELMKRLGIVFGCFDMVVTPEGEHVFLEVNEMGQFLWVEQQEPELMVLEPFCELLIEGRCDADWQPKADSLRFMDIYEDATRENPAMDDSVHVRPNLYATVDDVDTGIEAPDCAAEESETTDAAQPDQEIKTGNDLTHAV